VTPPITSCNKCVDCHRLAWMEVIETVRKMLREARRQWDHTQDSVYHLASVLSAEIFYQEFCYQFRPKDKHFSELFQVMFQMKLFIKRKHDCLSGLHSKFP
jgi:hypothetical protein